MKQNFIHWVVIMSLQLLLFSTQSCSQVGRKQQLDCFQKEIDRVKSSKEYASVMSDVSDTLNGWLQKDLRGVRYLKNQDFEISKAVFFDQNKSKCLLLLIVINRDTSATFDAAQIIGAEILNNEWNFYIQSYPHFLFNREDLKPKRPYTSEELIDYVTNDIISDGYFFPNACKIDYDYIDSDIWFADWMRAKHKEFLSDKW